MWNVETINSVLLTSRELRAKLEIVEMVREKLPSILEPHSSLTLSWSTFQKDSSKTNKNYID